MVATWWERKICRFFNGRYIWHNDNFSHLWHNYREHGLGLGFLYGWSIRIDHDIDLVLCCCRQSSTTSFHFRAGAWIYWKESRRNHHKVEGWYYLYWWRGFALYISYLYIYIHYLFISQSWPPYKSLIFSLPFWSLLLLHYGSMWGLFFLITATPKFLSEVSSTLLLID